MTTVEQRLDKVEEKLGWVVKWLEYFIMIHYEADNLSEVSNMQEKKNRLIERKEPDGLIV
jgi:hypothetical protein